MPQADLLARLADGEFHSGQVLANDMGVSRTAIWKQLARLEGLGLQLESIRGKGYRIPGGLDLLSEETIRRGLSAEAVSLAAEIAVLAVVDSTNSELLRRDVSPAGQSLICTAEQQQSGRGRRGRDWVSPFARSVYLSMTWDFAQGAAALEGLSLAAGVCVARALQTTGIACPQLKWPNDILFDGRKVGGILIEMTGDAAGPARVVLGVGVNVAMPTATAEGIDQPWTDLATVAGPDLPRRSAVVAELLNALLPMLASFEEVGFAAWREDWSALDAYASRPVTVTTGSRRTAGTGRGVNDRGALLLETTSGTVPMFGGEVTVRPA
ncbi:MAG: bifunctional biotin--[acetyl-CoA-carboxylase] ligase/biotin operon repressor BirA [Chromatocurvus sp.]